MSIDICVRVFKQSRWCFCERICQILNPAPGANECATKTAASATAAFNRINAFVFVGRWSSATTTKIFSWTRQTFLLRIFDSKIIAFDRFINLIFVLVDKHTHVRSTLGPIVCGSASFGFLSYQECTTVDQEWTEWFEKKTNDHINFIRPFDLFDHLESSMKVQHLKVFRIVCEWMRVRLSISWLRLRDSCVNNQVIAHFIAQTLQRFNKVTSDFVFQNTFFNVCQFHFSICVKLCQQSFLTI